MNTLRKNWAFLAIGLVSLLLGVLAVLTAIKLKQETPVAPTAPESKPKALEGSPVPACQLTFSITLASPSPSETPIPGATPSPTPTPTPAPTPTPTPTPSATPSPSVSPTPTPIGGFNPTPTPTPTPTPSVTPTPSPVLYCNSVCTSSSQCPSNLICYIIGGQTSGYCRNPSCQTDTDCICPAATPGPSATPTPTPAVTPTVPVAGNIWPTVFMIVGAVSLIIIGFAL